MKIYVGNDHRGYYMARELADWLASEGHEVELTGSGGNDPCDYPDWAKVLGEKVASATDGKGPDEAGAMGIGVCGSGVGFAMAVNKVKGIRAAPLWNIHIAEYAKRHNNANIVTFSADTQTVPVAKELLRIFMEARFEGGRHQRRIDKIRKLEEP